MALEELFVPTMTQLYGTKAQLLRNRVDFEDDLHVEMIVTLQSSGQFHVRHKLSTWLHRTVGKTAAMKFMQATKAGLRHERRSCFTGVKRTETSSKHNSLG
jgi:DNA-directed RNA polymerase specialized sigma24 family protein